jgi:hypothetical protein
VVLFKSKLYLLFFYISQKPCNTLEPTLHLYFSSGCIVLLPDPDAHPPRAHQAHLLAGPHPQVVRIHRRDRGGVGAAATVYSRTPLSAGV